MNLRVQNLEWVPKSSTRDLSEFLDYFGERCIKSRIQFERSGEVFPIVRNLLKLCSERQLQEYVVLFLEEKRDYIRESTVPLMRHFSTHKALDCSERGDKTEGGSESWSLSPASLLGWV